MNTNTQIPKNVLLSFIDKFHLNGLVNSVIIESEDTTIKTNFMTLTKDLIGYISCEGVEISDSKLNVFEVDKFKKMINIMSDTFDIEMEKDGLDDVKNIRFVDEYKTVTYTFVDDDVMKIFKAPNQKSITYQLEFDLPDWFISEYVKSKQSLTDSVNIVGITNTIDNNNISFVLNYSNNNVNNIKLNIPNPSNEVIPMNLFDSDYIKNIFLVNQGMEGKVSLNAKGLIKFSFKNTIFTNEYFMLTKKI